MKIKTAALNGLALDWAVDFAIGGKPLEVKQHKSGNGEWMFFFGGCPFPQGPSKYSTDWAKGGPIIERERIELEVENFPRGWIATPHDGNFLRGATALIAAMRCYVASKLGDEVDVPDELVA